MTVCKTCKAEVLYARNITTGRILILDAAPNQQTGTIVVDLTDDEARCHPLDQDGRRRAREEGLALYVSHFATCPDAKEHRRHRRGR